MLDIVFWIIIGALSGWVGSLSTRSEGPNHLAVFVLVGIAGGFSGGFAARILGIVEEPYLVNPDSVFSAILSAGIFVAAYSIVINFFGNPSSHKG